jgi:plasmid maintenance system antidote protein VapI
MTGAASLPIRALRLGRYFNTSARFWMNAQSSYDLEVAQDELQRSIERDVRSIVAWGGSSLPPAAVVYD